VVEVDVEGVPTWFDSAVEDDLKRILWLLVRFGYAIVAPRLKAALVELEMQEAWGDRVQLDQPWRHPWNVKIGQTLQELNGNSVDLKRILEELKQLNAGQLQNHEGFINASDAFDALEHEVATGIARHLGGGEVVAANYKWQSSVKGMPGDIDCVVTGFLAAGDDGGDAEPVVVLGEVRHNMANKYLEAVSQLRKNCQRWRQLCNLRDPPAHGEEGRVDYLALRVGEMRSRRVVLAFGGNLFPAAVDEQISEELEGASALQSLKPLRWLKVAPDSGTVRLVLSDVTTN
jgi:hypothetical protein